MSKWFKTRAKKKTILDDDWDFAKLRVDTVLPVLVGTKVMWAKSFPDVSQKKKKKQKNESNDSYPTWWPSWSAVDQTDLVWRLSWSNDGSDYTMDQWVSWLLIFF